MTIDAKREMLEVLDGMLRCAALDPDSIRDPTTVIALAQMLREVVKELGPTAHAEAVEHLRTSQP